VLVGANLCVRPKIRYNQVLCNVFYLRGSPEDKEMVEDRTVKLPTSEPRYCSELKYKAYHLSRITIETILKRNLPFLFPFIVEAELRSLDETSTSNALIPSLQKQIDEHEEELTEMISGLTAEQMESLRTTIEYLWGKSYSKDVFNKSTILPLMREQLNFRQRDIQCGRLEERAERTARETNVFQLMLEEGKINREQIEYFLKRMEEEDEKRKSSTNINEQ